LTSVVLGFEAVVIFLASLVLFGLKSLPPIAALAGGWSLALVMLLSVPFLRFRWALALGWVLQALVIASGFIQPAMFFVGICFVGAWTFATIAGGRIDKEKAATK
jgi:hypothetical protein